MKLSDGVEWSIHCCTVLSLLPDGIPIVVVEVPEDHPIRRR